MAALEEGSFLFVLLSFETRPCCVAQAGLKSPGCSGIPPTSALQVAETKDMCHVAQLAWESYLGVTQTSGMHANLATNRDRAHTPPQRVCALFSPGFLRYQLMALGVPIP